MPISPRAADSIKSGRPVRSRPRRWIVDPLVRGLTGLPLALAAVPMCLTGHADTAARMQLRLVATFSSDADGLARAGRRSDMTVLRVMAHSGLVIVPATLAFAATAMQLFTVWSGYFYPLRPDTIAALDHPFTPDRQVLSEAWGGPTLVGAWAVHACVAFGLQAMCAALLVGLCKMQNLMAKWLITP
jgi:hypothetical protein